MPFTGWSMDRDALVTHVRSELALHRWDLVGSDDESLRLLAEPALTAHAVRALTSFDVIAERASARARRGRIAHPTEFRLRVDGSPDVLVSITGEGPDMSLATPDGRRAIETDAAGRLLLLWGRRPPTDRHAVWSTLRAEEQRAADRWLFGRRVSEVR